jgi:hypothetical protein
MTIDEAIELLKVAIEGFPVGDCSEQYYKAMELGIEALKRIKYYREELERNKILKVHLLPGETEK